VYQHIFFSQYVLFFINFYKFKRLFNPAKTHPNNNQHEIQHARQQQRNASPEHDISCGCMRSPIVNPAAAGVENFDKFAHG
jgi:hypothetical protein